MADAGVPPQTEDSGAPPRTEDIDHDGSKRLRTLTTKGTELFEKRKAELFGAVEKAWDVAEELVMKFDESTDDVRALKSLEKQLRSHAGVFVGCCDTYAAFLKRENIKDTIDEVTAHENSSDRRKKILKDTLQAIGNIKMNLLETMSERSSITSSKRAAAEASKVKLHFKRKEAEIRLEKAKLKEEHLTSSAKAERVQTELDLNLEMVKLEGETAVAEVEAEAEDDPEIDEHSVTDRQDFTREFVQKLNLKSVYNNSEVSGPNLEDIEPVGPAHNHLNKLNIKQDYRASIYEQGHKDIVQTNDSSVLNPNATSFSPGGDATMTGLSTFLLKKDLQLSRFSKFDDKAENFAAWKATFRSIASELSLSPLEEIDLLVKYLGLESSRFASSIKASNVHDPARGVVQIWERLEQRYGRPEMVEASLKKKLGSFPKLHRDMSKLYDLLDILCEIESLKTNPLYSNLLAYYDSSSGVSPIVNKLPHGIQEKWAFRAARYKKDRGLPYPPFSFFVLFIREISETKNDPAFRFEAMASQEPRAKHNVFSRKQEVVGGEADDDSLRRCPLHRAEHSLNSCRGFRMKPIEERKKILRENRVCFRCCETSKHGSKDCKAVVKCVHCGRGHASAMHMDRAQMRSGTADGGESAAMANGVSTRCTTLCGDKFIGKSCSKTVLLDVYPSGHPEKAQRVYAIIDDQSNRSLASQELFDKLQIKGEATKYTLSSCSGRVTMLGRRAEDLCVQSVSQNSKILLPPVIECDDIPNEVSEIPTPEVAMAYGHLRRLKDKIPELDPNCKVHLLIGRDLPEAHHILEQVVGDQGAPFAQRLSLGWVIIGEVCLGKMHQPEVVSARKTNVMPDGRATHFEPCPFNLDLKEQSIRTSYNMPGDTARDFRGDSIYLKTAKDDTVGLSVEDRQFLKLMETEMKRDDEGFWTAPLPFKSDPMIPNNRSLALHRAKILDNSLKKDTTKKEHFVAFMKKVLDNGAAEVAQEQRGKNCYYLPLFGVYHPRKPNQLRGVFDSSAVFQGTSLNSLLMTGPDLVNSLVGILLRFRKDAYAITADVEQMFYRFRVNQEHRDFLRFFWYKNNNPDEELLEYRMKVHVFGNCASPAVATYGLNKAVEKADEEVKDCVRRNFYVDDALDSKPSAAEAIDLMKKTQSALKDGGNIRLHKIASNSLEVMKAFPQEDLGSDLKDLDTSQDALPVQRSLGIHWSLKEDSFFFVTELDNKPFTRRGLLSMVNSIFDPLGFIAPITISGKILLRKATPPGVDWDEPLPDDHQKKWNEWKESLLGLQKISTTRMFTEISFSQAEKKAVYIFSDASEEAIAAVAYMKLWDKQGNASVGFLLGKAKLAPLKGHTIPRLELCGAVLATEVAEIVSAQLDIPLNAMTYFTDSKVVLGYISNRTRRFFTYVSNRVEKILKISDFTQWRYVPTDKNPADIATRCSTVRNDLNGSIWFPGPKLLRDIDQNDGVVGPHPLIHPENDKDIKPDVSVMKTQANPVPGLGCARFKRFSSWKSLVQATLLLKSVARAASMKDSSKGNTLTEISEAEVLLLKEVQRESFQEEMSCMTDNRPLRKCSKLLSLSPYLDGKGILRVGGRLNRMRSKMSVGEVNPVILPKNHHMSLLLIRHYHETVKHQGRVLTEGALRTAGYWVIGAKRMISSLIHGCVTCRRLRREPEQQKMADLPEDRLTPGPPFESVGVDAFGPWQVLTRKTRGGAANSKRWAIMFTCLTTRAVHIEVIEEMSSSSFINALRRFLSIRGPVKLFRSDRGTNFIGAVEELKCDVAKIEEAPVRRFFDSKGIRWVFNVPHSSHMGGVWERMIGLTRKVLDSILYENRHHPLTHESLTTFMAEVTAILNNRPLVPISSDSDSPFVLRPSMLLTGKVDVLQEAVADLTEKDAYKAQWKRVQLLSDAFWHSWKRGYLQILQTRRKWTEARPNIKEGDVVVLRDTQVHRNMWPLGIVQQAFPSEDGMVRKVQVRIVKDGKSASYLRPINEVVVLVV